MGVRLAPVHVPCHSSSPSTKPAGMLSTHKTVRDITRPATSHRCAPHGAGTCRATPVSNAREARTRGTSPSLLGTAGSGRTLLHGAAESTTSVHSVPQSDLEEPMRSPQPTQPIQSVRAGCRPLTTAPEATDPGSDLASTPRPRFLLRSMIPAPMHGLPSRTIIPNWGPSRASGRNGRGATRLSPRLIWFGHSEEPGAGRSPPPRSILQWVEARRSEKRPPRGGTTAFQPQENCAHRAANRVPSLPKRRTPDSTLLRPRGQGSDPRS